MKRLLKIIGAAPSPARSRPDIDPFIIVCELREHNSQLQVKRSLSGGCN